MERGGGGEQAGVAFRMEDQSQTSCAVCCLQFAGKNCTDPSVEYQPADKSDIACSAASSVCILICYTIS